MSTTARNNSGRFSTFRESGAPPAKAATSRRTPKVKGNLFGFGKKAKARRRKKLRSRAEVLDAKASLLRAKAKRNGAAQRKIAPARFPATRTPQRVTKILRVRDIDTGEQGTVLGRKGRGAQSFLKVKWDNRQKATLIKPDQLAVARNGKGEKGRKRRRFVFKIGARIVSNPMTIFEVIGHGANASVLLGGIQTARHMLSADKKPAKRKPTARAAGKRLAERRHQRNPKPSSALQNLHQDFLGKPNSGKVMKLYVAPGQPLQNSALAPLIKIEMANGSEQAFKIGTAWLGATEHNLPIKLSSFANAGKTRRLRIGLRQPFPLPANVKNPGGVTDFGEVKKVWYQVAKPHLYPNQGVIRFHHTMGEEGGRRPRLMMRNGCLFFKGGDYTIEREGIAN